MRRKIVAGNWKMNKTVVEASGLARALHERIGDVTDPLVLVCPAFPALTEVAMTLKDSEIQVGAQNMHEEDSGAFTGEVAADMLLTAGCTHVILGHSERRQYFGETDRTVNGKTRQALKKGLTPIVCIGETLDQREAGKTEDVIEEQIQGSLDSLSKDDLLKLIIAYEPVWAIGTGKTATPEQAEEVHVFIRKLLAGRFGADTAEEIPVLYGGSVKGKNAAGLFEKDNIDGGLVGGASLDPDDFAAIVGAMREVRTQ
jgi:triosephosphate isomerase